MSTAAIVLAAGRSRRFGPADKLLAPLESATVIEAAMAPLAGIELARRIAVISSPAVADLARNAGFEIVQVAPGQPQAESLKAGLAQIRDSAITRILVTLGDMPFLHSGDLARLLDFPPSLAACAACDGIPMPPAIFPRAEFGRLAQLSGDRGAGHILRDLPPAQWLGLPAKRLRDIDTAEDLARAAGGQPHEP